MHRHRLHRGAVLSPEKWRRLLALRDNGQIDALEQVEQEEYWLLREERREELRKLTPVPPCCKAAERYPVIYWAVDVDDELGSDKSPGLWVLVSPNEDLRPRDYDYRERPAPTTCPFCAVPLPRMRRKFPPPENLCRIEDGGYYCATCCERLDGCLCDPPESAWEPDPEQT